MQENPSREARLRTALLRAGSGDARLLRQLLSSHGSVAAAWRQRSTVPAALRESLSALCDPGSREPRLAPPDEAFLALVDAAMLSPDDPQWPALLAEIRDAPPLLFCRGDTAVLGQPQIAIVGSRHASPAGLALARAFAADLAAAGFVITSGMALGIDAMAHEGALAAGGRTIAVLGCGADVVYPRRHDHLAARIRASGCLVSELLPGSAPLAHAFPRRNRIISGLVLGVLVVEAAPDSGSLITARCAAEQGREVFAIPGSIHSPTARGCHQLIREGATLVETSAELVDALLHFAGPRLQPILPVAPPASGATTAEEAHLLALLAPEGSSIDDLVLASSLGVARIGAVLSALALRGRVHALPGGRWQPA